MAQARLPPQSLLDAQQAPPLSEQHTALSHLRPAPQVPCPVPVQESPSPEMAEHVLLTQVLPEAQSVGREQVVAQEAIGWAVPVVQAMEA